MEVHHHPQLEHKPKPWKEYFLEFLMIFLAVTMGFFAESLREHISDGEKGKKYSHSFVEDLRKDTAALRYSIKRLKADIHNGERLIFLFHADKLATQPDTAILKLSVGCGLSVDVAFNDRTASQLKGTGSMRLIQNKAVADSMLQYWNNQIYLEQIHNRFETLRMEQHNIGFKTFNWYIAYYNNVKTNNKNMLSVKKAIIDKGRLNEFVNSASVLYNLANTSYLPLLNTQRRLAESMIKMIEKK